MPTNRKRVPRRRKESGLTGAEEMFLYGKTDKQVNPFELMDLQYPRRTKTKERVEELKNLNNN